MELSKEDVAFVRKGNGRDLVLLHGYLSSKEAFLPLVDYFSAFYRVTALDFCGFGKSAPLPYAFSVDDYAEWTEEAFELLGIVRPLCIAHSFGCRVVVKMQARAARKGAQNPFSKVVLTGPAGIMQKRTVGYYAKVKAYRITRRVFPKFAEKRFGSAEYRTLSPAMKESYKKIVGEDLRADIAAADCETLVIEGANDAVITPSEAEEYAALLPRGRMKKIDGGHFAFAENATAFTMETEEFFE